MIIARENISGEESIIENARDGIASDYRSIGLNKKAVDIMMMHGLLDNMVYDLGAGDGPATRDFISRGVKVVAVEPNPSKVGMLGKINMPIGSQVVNDDMDSYLSSFDHKTIPNVYIVESLEYFVGAQVVMKHIQRVLKDGGLCMIVASAKQNFGDGRHVVIEKMEDLVPEGFTPIKMFYEDDLFWVLSKRIVSQENDNEVPVTNAVDNNTVVQVVTPPPTITEGFFAPNPSKKRKKRKKSLTKKSNNIQ